jgi:RNA ligase (TIGR02306 family)
MDRHLASVQIVQAREPIPGADAIERLRILGWWVVAKKGEFVPGDLVVYVEIDSLLPERPEFEFLRKSSWKPPVSEEEGGPQRSGFHLRTVKLRGQFSQGLCLPVSILPAGSMYDIGTDVTTALDIIKYEGPIPAEMRGKAKGRFPGFMSKTGAVRVQVLGELLLRHAGTTLIATEKLDGTSFTAFCRAGEFGICSRDYHLDETDETSVLARLAARLDLKARMLQVSTALDCDFALQGEVVGPGLAQNRYKRQEHKLFVFTVIDLRTGAWLSRKDARRITDALEAVGAPGPRDLDWVPEVGSITLPVDVDTLVAMSEGPSALYDVAREGLVFRPDNQINDPDVGRLGFKVINPVYLTKFGG